LSFRVREVLRAQRAKKVSQESRDLQVQEVPWVLKVRRAVLALQVSLEQQESQA
jgi:hypothetical protein